MTIGFRMGVPGMRIRVSNHGVRASVGPRGARVNVGGGRRTTVSTGFGPFFASTALGRAPARKGHPAQARRGLTSAQLASQQRSYERVQADAEKQAAGRQLAAALDALVAVHRGTWRTAIRPVVPLPALPSFEQVEEQAHDATTAGIGRLHVTERRTATQAGTVLAHEYLADVEVQAQRWQVRVQSEADGWWRRLLANDEPVVCEAMTSALADDAAGGVAVSVDAGVAFVVVTAVAEDELPPRRPDVTPTGRPTLKTLTAKQLHRLFLDALVSTVAATLREGFAVAPGLAGITVGVVTRSARTRQLGVVMFGTWTRAAVDATPGAGRGTRWASSWTAQTSCTSTSSPRARRSF